MSDSKSIVNTQRMIGFKWSVGMQQSHTIDFKSIVGTLKWHMLKMQRPSVSAHHPPESGASAPQKEYELLKLF